MSTSNKQRYAAKLLFQFRVGPPENSAYRLCEERIVTAKFESAGAAYARFEQRGRDSQTSYLNEDGEQVSVEFIGITDMLELGLEAEADEVWYDIKKMLRPMERKDRLVPSKARILRRITGD